MEAINQSLSLLRRQEVEARTGLKRSKLYALMTEGTFPAQVKLGVGSTVAWVESDIEAWIQRQIDNGRNALTKQPNAAWNFLREVLALGAMTEPTLRSQAEAYGIAWETIEATLADGLVTRTPENTTSDTAACRWALA